MTKAFGLRIISDNEDRTAPALQSPECRQLLEMYDRFYRENGYHPPWSGYYMVEDGAIVGSCGFIGRPVNGQVELAYWTFEAFQGRGLATRACAELIAIANAAAPKLHIVAKTAPGEGPSTRILRRNGFVFHSAVQDHEIGDAWLWELIPTSHTSLSDEYRILPFRPAHREAILEIWEASVRHTHDFLTASDVGFFKEIVHGLDFNSFNLYCIESEGRICGFIGVVDAKVEMLFLDPASIGRGFGKALLQFAITRLGAAAVDVNEQNTSAVAFYQSQGFEAVHRTETDGSGKPYPILQLQLRLRSPKP